jgi:hypothetical protein
VTEKNWPVAGQQVTALIDDIQDQRCVVDDVRPPHGLVLRKPVTLPHELSDGSSVLLRWKTSAGRHEMLTRLTGQVWDHMPLWQLDAQREPSVWQRRAFTRAPDALPVHLRQEDELWRGVAVDLSEGGARCVLRSAKGVVLGAPASLHLMLEEQHLALPGTVLSLETDPEERQIVRLQFDPLGRIADLLRRRVMEQQRRERALSRT